MERNKEISFDTLPVYSFILMSKYAVDYMDSLKVVVFSIIVYLLNTISVPSLDRKIIYKAGIFSSVLYVAHTAIIWLPADVYPAYWPHHFIMWIIATNILAVLVYLMAGAFSHLRKRLDVAGG